MTLNRKIFAVLALIAGLAPMAVAEPVIGKPAPDFTGKGSNGKDYKLSEFKGKYVVLEWFNPGCPFVRKHYDGGNMQGLQERYAGQGVIWLSVNSSAAGKEGNLSPNEAEELRVKEKHKSDALILDPKGKIGRLYGAKTTPHMFIVDPKGNLIYMGAIDDKKSVDPADIATSKNYVAAALDEAMAGKPVTTASTQSYGCSVKY